jgi:hypothetical protein
MESVGLWRFMIGANYFHLAMVIYLQLPYFRGAIKGHALLVRLLTYGVAVLLGTSVASSSPTSTRTTVVSREVPPYGGDGGGGAPECPICLENISPENKIITSCNHVFHKHCIEELKSRERFGGALTKCPLCRSYVIDFTSGGGGGGGGGSTATVVASTFEDTTVEGELHESARGEIRRETLLGEFTAAAEHEEEVDLSKKKNN